MPLSAAEEFRFRFFRRLTFFVSLKSLDKAESTSDWDLN